jgi:phosphate transport system permease protein
MTEPEDAQQTTPAGAPEQRAGRSYLHRRLYRDRIARWCVTFGGVTIILSILAILFVIAAEVYPLFKPPALIRSEAASPTLPAPPYALGVEEYQEIAYVVTREGVHFVSVSGGAILSTPAIAGLDTARITGVSALRGERFALGLSDGRILPVEVGFSVSFMDAGQRRIAPHLTPGVPSRVAPDGRPVTLLASVAGDEGTFIAAMTGPKDLALITVEEQPALIGEGTRTETVRTLSLPIEGEVRSLAMDERGEDIFAGTSMGQVVQVGRDPANGLRVTGIVSVTGQQGTGVSLLGLLNGDRTLLIGEETGAVSSWQVIREPGGERRLRRINAFVPHERAAVAFAPSRRDKGFVTLDAGGAVHLSYATTGKTLVTADAGLARPVALSFAPKADGILVIDDTGKMARWTVDNPHPEVSWRGLFGQLWYEGSAEPEYTWQSTGGTDEFEPKFSLTPLIYGTLKGTFYSLLFAIPIAVLSAFYVSQFIHPVWKTSIKSIVEIMAALPSVVLGFIAGLWLAPTVERFVPGLFLAPAVIALCILLTHYLWRIAPGRVRAMIRPGTEVFLLIPVVLLGGMLSFVLGDVIETGLMAGDYRDWLFEALGWTYDQRNSLVVGFAMGFAVIPIIFTIAEDSLSNVPGTLVAGSLALGATRWQTALRIVLPSASPGIFSAVMIGFGRAVGETMIVLMATGNTPVMDWSMFNGFRALSANIAVELPEAPQGGTLYRVLFLAAFLLFVTTFVVNTVAELVRLHLRKKYRYL